MPPFLIDIPQMIDLALGTPEIGVVNFTVLHNLLHAIVEIMNLDKYRVEFRGNHGMKIEKLIQHIPAEPIVVIEEYKVEITNDQEEKGNKRTLISKQKDDQFERILVIRKTEEMERDNISVAIRGRQPVQQPLQIISQDDFRKLVPRDESIHDPIGRILPNNQDVFDSARGESVDSRNPVGEMWYAINVTKRVDATEVAIEKITSMLRDMSEEYHKLKKSVEKLTTKTDAASLVDKVDLLEKKFYDQFGHQPTRSAQPTPGESHKARQGRNLPPVFGQGGASVNRGDVSPSAKHSKLHPGSSSARASRGHSSGPTEPTSDRKSGGGFAGSDSERPLQRDNQNSEHFGLHRHGNIEDILDDYYNLKAEVERFKIIIENMVSPKTLSDTQVEEQATPALASPPKIIPGTGAKGDLLDISRRIELFESKLKTVEHQIFDVERDLAELTDRFEDDIRPNLAIKTDMTGIADIYSNVTVMKTDLDSTKDKCDFLMIERDRIVESIDKITKTMQDLKNFKVDRDEIDELLAEKADYNMLQRKVSVDQFDATKRHLTNGLVEVLDRLAQQGDTWEQTIYEVRSMTLNKVGREEITQLREYIDSNINAVKDRLKALAALRRDPEAAGTKFKFLRNVNCISCDQDVVMRIDESSVIPRSEPMPEPRTLKPFLVYELDSIRKQMKDPYSRNLHHFETMTSSKQRVMIGGQPKMLANRYCGGSHTVLTPQDRVQRFKFTKKLVPAEYIVKTDEECYYKAIKKDCTCPNEKDHLLKDPNYKQANNARSSKLSLKITTKADQVDTIQKVKHASSARSSRNNTKISREGLLETKMARGFKQTVTDTLSDSKDISHAAFVASMKDQIQELDLKEVENRNSVDNSTEGNIQAEKIIHEIQDELIDAIEYSEDYGSGLNIGEKIDDTLSDYDKKDKYNERNENNEVEIV